MKDKIKMLVNILLLVVFIGGSYFAYSYLSNKDPEAPNDNYNQQVEPNLENIESLTDNKAEPVIQMEPITKPLEAENINVNKEIIKNDDIKEPEKSEEDNKKDNGNKEEPPVLIEETFDNAEDFVVYDKDGNEVKLSDFEGKKTVVNFWATWCGYCVREMPEFNKLYQEKNDKINFVMINSFGESKETVDKFMEENAYTFPVYYDSKNEAVNTYNITGIPVTMVFDEHRQLLKKHVGVISENVLRELLEQ